MRNRVKGFAEIHWAENTLRRFRKRTKGLPEIIEDIAAFDETVLLNRGDGCNEILQVQRHDARYPFVAKVLEHRGSEVLHTGQTFRFWNRIEHGQGTGFRQGRIIQQ